MPRADLTNDVVHWIRGESNEHAFETLRHIVGEQRLLGGDGHIRGGYRCVCFTEAPQTLFHQVLGRYRPFGLRLCKKWLFSQGGRPVIYQADEEFEQLPDSHRWRHVRYEPARQPPIDFSWEREWRVRTDALPLLPQQASIIVPDEKWMARLEEDHNEREGHRIEFEAVAYGDEWHRWQDPEPFTYAYSVIHL
jgi:hypothetical protein